ncbi:MAG: RES domain-containing protein [Verrucomicrobia bacterium]|nr:MAG: RES domain-containing protein [Verrucomicrobiota bacterium]
MSIYLNFDEMLNPIFFHLISDKRVCGDCLNDSGLKKFLACKIPPNTQECSYCQQTTKTVDVDELQQYILQFFPYADADQELPIAYLREDEGMWHDQWDTLEKFVDFAVCDELYEDFSNNLVDARYCQWQWSSLTPTQQRYYQWQEFREVVCYEDGEFRLYPKTEPEDRNHDELCPSEFYQALAAFLCRTDALSILPSGSEIHRVHWGHLEDDKLNFSRLTCPRPELVKRPNRFSPSGQSMFYGAKDFDTACLEIRATEGDAVTHAVFRTKRELCLVDFTAVKRPDGKFDYEWLGNYHISEFLDGFLADIRKEVKGEGDAAEYVPTQAICRYFKTQGATEILNIHLNNPVLSPELKLLTANKKIDGFCYRSSKGTERTCYVLFCGNEESTEMLELVPSPARTTFHPSPTLQESVEAMLNAVEK